MAVRNRFFRPVQMVCDQRAVNVREIRLSYSWAKFLAEVALRPNDAKGGVDRCSDFAVPVECFQYVPFKNHMKYYDSRNLMVSD